MKSNNSDNLTVISKYNLDLVSEIINNKEKKRNKILSNNFLGNLQLFLINKKDRKKEDYAFILEDLSDVSEEFKKSLLNETVDFEIFKIEIKNYFKLIIKTKYFFNRIILSSFEIFEKSNLLNIFTHYEKNRGPSYLINAANNMLAEFISKTNNILLRVFMPLFFYV